MEPMYLLGLLIALLLFLPRLLKKKVASQTMSMEAANFQLILNQILLRSKYSNLARYWYWISKMETAGFTSPIFKNANNPWGMKNPNAAGGQSGFKQPLPGGRRTTALPGGYQPKKDGAIWARYANLTDAVNDLILYMDNFNYPTAAPSLEAFIRKMGEKGYFGTQTPDSYYKLVKAWQER